MFKNIKDITGQKFNRLFVNEYAYSKNGRSYWNCTCDCGNKVIIKGYRLVNNNTKSCGCLNIEKIRERSIAKLYAGQKFGRLTIIGYDHTNYQRTFWKCICDCGKIHIVCADKLISGHTKSCGCLHKEVMHNKLLGANNHMWKGGVKDKNNAIRDLAIYQEWRNKVFKRDNYTCKICGKHGTNLEAHHKIPFSKVIWLRFAVWNGITVCKKCHSKLKWHEIIFK